MFQAGSAYEAYVYDKRGQSYGKINYSGGTPVSSVWTLISQNPQNAARAKTFTFSQSEDGTVSTDASFAPNPNRLNIKVFEHDKYGNPISVADYQREVSGTLFTKDHLPSFSEIETEPNFILNGAGSPLAKAEYRFDAFGHPIEAVVGTGGEQVRSFIFDQMSRLRLESHPEMAERNLNGAGVGPVNPVLYTKYDSFGNLTEKVQAGRTETFVYNAAGMLLQQASGDQTDTYQYAYDLEERDDRVALALYPDLPVKITSHTGDGLWVAYRFEYEPIHGLPTKRAMLPNVARFDGFGYSETGVPAWNDTAGWAAALTSAYTYDGEDRTKTMTYPAAVDGNTQPTKLNFVYDPSHNKIAKIRDVTLVENAANYDSAGITLFENFNYGPGGAATQYKFALPNDNDLLWQQAYDDMNRITRIGYQFGLSYNMDYQYDSQNRIAEIRRNWLSYKDFRYACDGLGQVSEAVVPNAEGNSQTLDRKTYRYTYDVAGLGNLMTYEVDERNAGQNSGFQALYSNAADIANNQLVDMQYNAAGELVGYKDPETQAAFAFVYNDRGRLSQAVSWQESLDEATNQMERYETGAMLSYFNNAGIRWLQLPDTYFDADGNEQETDEPAVLYFYDGSNRILSEFRDNDQGDGTRWDKTYLYLGNNTAVTYEYEAYQAPVTQSPSVVSQPLSFEVQPAQTNLPAPLHIHQPFDVVQRFQWGAVGDAYSYEIEVAETATDGSQNVVIHTSSSATSYPLSLSAGTYYVRARAAGGTWNQWLPVTVQ